MSAEKMTGGVATIECVNGGTLDVRKPRYKRMHAITSRLESAEGGTGNLEALAAAASAMIVGATGVTDEEGKPVAFKAHKVKGLGPCACQELVDALEIEDLNNVIGHGQPSEIDSGNLPSPPAGDT